MNKILLLIFYIFIGTSVSAALINDNIVDLILKDKTIERPEIHEVYNYQNMEKLPIRLRIIKRISSEKNIYEGQQILFRVQSSVYYKGNLVVERGTIVNARVETIVKSGMNGIPAGIVLGSFKIGDIPKSKLTDVYELQGQDRSLWVYPLKWALTILPPSGSLTNFIKGGHAKLEEYKTIEIYYYPNWI